MRLANWKEVMDTANLSPDKDMDLVSKWLIITRAAVFTMTATSAVIGGLLAAAVADNPDWVNFALATFGLLIAHAGNNMNNDYFDLEGGVDTEDYARALYAPHPVLGGLVSQRRLGGAVLLANALDLIILIVLALRTGWPAVFFALAGLFISFFYVAPPLKLKHHALGELGVFLVWGPLMIGGTYFVTAGSLPTLGVWLATIPYGIAVITVLMGKHIDKVEADTAKQIRTLPVVLGEKTSLRLNVALMVGFYGVVLALVLTGTLGIWLLLVVLALPRLRAVLKLYREPKPSEPPEGYTVWPLWYVSGAFYHNKRAGLLFVAGLLLNLLVPLSF
ncbi:MAG: prenyltransferase [Chloroflexi bacterium]|nr:prenyltransferase [Chloroflexota bacterium]MCI0772654.1 prenyltransferase [Chloroflexota bacterium]MCI0860562.1 prenyltransferase [Chloroflexota bacterium]MCI0875425.1 prenyltransferase [Chloroflexota bacterium]MCI0891354.1 prenyltransferase [Chloroflexota bacterium]